jgi:preprotein translocase subunit YajC
LKILLCSFEQILANKWLLRHSKPFTNQGFTMKKFLPLLALPAAVFAQDAAAPQGGGMYQTFVMIGIALVFFYFILWRPEQKRRKAAEKLRSSLKKGDKVTAMAIIGTIDRITDTTVILKMVDGSKIEVLKAAITDVQHVAEPTVES